MKSFILIFQSIKYSEWCSLIYFGGIIYFFILAPGIFRFWLIPGIEKRYATKLIFSSPSYSLVMLSNWIIPAGEISGYIICQYMKWPLPGLKKPHMALKKINYDIKTASKAEIIISFITGCVFLSMVISVAMYALI